MDYLKFITTPANTLESNPLITPLHLAKGRITGGALYFPRGPSGYLHFTAHIASWQILPFNTEESYRLNGTTFPLHLDLDFFQPPYLINFMTWNDSTTYSHSLTVSIFLDPYAKPRKTKNIFDSTLNAVTGYLKGNDRKI